MKRTLSLLLTLALLCAAMPALAASKAPAAQEITTPVTISVWHSMSGSQLTALEDFAKAFNEMDNKITVSLEYQGDYDEAITKLRSLEPGACPDIMQLYEIGTAWMANSSYPIVMQSFIDRDNADISDIQPNILAFYSFSDGLYSMPFNSSVPVLYYNKTALDALGLTAQEAFGTVDDCVQTAVKLKEAGMTYGGTFSNYSWNFEQFLSVQEADMVDAGNGREGIATRAIFGDTDVGLKTLEAWKKIYATGASFYFGQGPMEDFYQFLAGNVGFILMSSAGTGVALNSIGDKFVMDLAPLPKISPEDKGGVSVGGGSMWILDNGDDLRANAAWEFIKFITQPDNQAHWTVVSGYLPVSIAAQKEPAYIDYITNVNPLMPKIVQALEQSTPESAAALFGVYTQSRVIIQNAIEEMINSDVSAQDTLDTIISQIDDEIYMYNRTNK